MLSVLNSGAAPGIRCDVAIAGAGAAGITLALALADQGLKVALLESGGLEFEQDVQDLYAGRIAGREYFDLDVCRLRFLGGSTNHWGGQCTLLDQRDFERRPWTEGSGWPIDRSDLEPHLERAHDILDLGPVDFEPRSLGAPEPGLIALDEDKLEHRSFRYSSPPTPLGGKYLADLEQAGDIDLLLYASLVEIRLAEPHGPVAGFEVVDRAGQRARVQARAYVLALGGIENARMLLASDRDAPGGIGNRHDLVGRYFTEHTALTLGSVQPLAADWERAYQEFVHPKIGRHVRHWMAPGDRLMREQEIGNIATVFGERTYIRPRAPGYVALHEIKESLQGREKLPDGLGWHIVRVLEDLDGAVMGLWERYDPTIYVSAMAEQVPNPESRVRLGDERDPLGLRRVILDWRLSETDRRTAAVMIQAIAEEFGRLGIGRVQVAEWLREESGWDPYLAGNNHHLGTTRMANDPRDGVVDRNQRVHGCPNLFVAGSSVFVTGGFANPTLSIVSLTLRLADHLKAQLAAGAFQMVGHAAAADSR